jgi:glycosyltransferase involved in cell wall biosynthesis
VTAPDVVVDADVLGRQRTGDETYIQQLLVGLSELDTGLDIHAIARGAELVPEGITPEVLPVRMYAARLAWHLPRRLRSLNPGVAHFQYVIPPTYGGTSVVTVHDISYDVLPELEDRAAGFVLRRLVPRSLNRAARILTGSEWTKADLVRRYRLDTARVVVTPYGVDGAFSPHGPRPDEGAPYLLFVGALRSRKDPVTALEALARLPSEMRLVMIGPPRGETERVRATISRLDLEHRVDLLGHVSQAELTAYYRGAQCFVLPSLYEGFGMPVVEAMASGTPVVSTTVSAIPEVAEGAAILVPAKDPDALADGILRAIGDRDRLVAAGLERAKRYSWSEMSRRTLEVYRELL